MSTAEKQPIKYLIVGAGGTGGAIGAYMARGGKNITFIVRGEHLKAMKEKGLKVELPDDEFVISPVQAADSESYHDKPDVVFVCVKGYSLKDITPFLQRISDEHTIIIPILNIFTTGKELAEALPGRLVTDGCIYVAAQIKEPGCIQMRGEILRLFFGVRNKEDFREELKTVDADLRESGIEGGLSEDIKKDALIKFACVSPQGACGLFYNTTAGEIRKPGEIRDCYITLVKEIESLAEAMGIHFGEDIVARNLAILDGVAPDTTTSLQRDVASGGASEIDGLIYEVVRLGDEYGVAVPEYRKISEELKRRGLT